MPVFFIDDSQVEHDRVHVAGPLLHHLRSSLRVVSGEELTLAVPSRCRYRVRVDHVDARLLTGTVLDRLAAPTRLPPPLVLAQAILKGERMDWVIQKSTELGIAAIIPLVTRRGVVRPRKEGSSGQQERWHRIALEAAQQSERWDIPSISVATDAECLFEDPSQASLRLILSERTNGDGLQTVDLSTNAQAPIIVAVGPEGGWTGNELDHARRFGFTPVSLGPRILRAETAGIAALCLLQHRLGQLG
jgi:16S rRNA (uracil1498-N3)-methyltransferase